MSMKQDIASRELVIAVGTDHGGLELKNAISAYLAEKGHTIMDCGASSFDPNDDYPEFAASVGLAVSTGNADAGILFCRWLHQGYHR